MARVRMKPGAAAASLMALVTALTTACTGADGSALVETTEPAASSTSTLTTETSAVVATVPAPPLTEIPTTFPTITVPVASSTPAACGANHLSGAVIRDVDLVEASGIIASRAHPGVFWSHNDNADDNRIFALDENANVINTLELAETSLIDVEDIAIGPGPGQAGDHLYIADVGDNLPSRPEIAIFRLPEPSPTAETTARPDHLVLTYPDKPRDAEAIAVDPITGEILVFEKAHKGDPTLVFRAPPAGAGDQRIELEAIAEIDMGELIEQHRTREAVPSRGKPFLITAADVTADGSALALRTYGHVWIWGRTAGNPLWSVFAEAPSCEGATVRERQGEAFAFTPDGAGYVTLSEGPNRELNRFG